MLDDNKLKNLNVPPLRFPEFSGEWERCRYKDILSIGNGRDYKHLSPGDIPVFGTGGLMTNVDDYIYDGESVFIGRKGTINKPFYHMGRFWTVDTLFYTHSFRRVLPKFVLPLFERTNWLLYNEASGVPSLSKSTIENISTNIPSIEEQVKISEFLTLINERIETQKKIIDKLKKLKSAINSALLINDCWDEYTIGDLCESISTKQYICPSASEDGIYPIIQQGENPVVGYTKSAPFKDYNKVVLFGDHTLSTYRPCTPFLLSTDGIKILAPKPQIIRDFLYYLLEAFKPQPEGYKRHYSILKDVRVHVPPIAKQESIVRGLIEIDLKQNVESRILSLLQLQKQYLLTQMFI